jgi:hypothetical protein
MTPLRNNERNLGLSFDIESKHSDQMIGKAAAH